MRSAEPHASLWLDKPKLKPNPNPYPTKTTKKLKCIVLGGANAGKTSILRKYFHGNFDPGRRPTVGSDFYTKKFDDPTFASENVGNRKEDKNEVSIPQTANRHPAKSPKQHPKLSMQIWDTPGRERLTGNKAKPMYTAAFSDNFFKNADAAVLVYDITSSTSFTHVLNWHADLTKRIVRLEATGERTRPFPVLIVGNKIDIRREREGHTLRRHAVVKQRDVMGLAGRQFRGKDSRYEYTASVTPNRTGGSNSSLTSGSSNKLSRHQHKTSTFMGTGHQTSYLHSVLNNDGQIGSYLESLLSTEDGSHPDKDMVLLWCMRNGLKHMEVSALDGTGVEELINEMIQMALEARNLPTPTIPFGDPNQNHNALSELKRNEELDLQRRYAPKGRSCCALTFSQCFEGQ